MTEAQTGTGMTPSPPTTAPRPRARSWRSLLAATEIDTRLLGMVVAIAAIWIAFNILSGGDFLTARNLWNLSVQSTSIAIMATGMVLIIVSRNIDLSVGSLLGFLGYTMALVQTDGTIAFFGIDFTIDGLQSKSYVWVVALLVGMLLGALVGAVTGSIVAYGGVPSFIVTLGGFLIWRGMIFRTGDKQGADPLAAGRDLPAVRWRSHGLARRVAKLGTRAAGLRRRRGRHLPDPAPPATVSTSPSARCGSRSAWVCSAAQPSSPPSG